MNIDLQGVVSFQNSGCIDPRSFTVIGVSVKEGPNPIGYFGTGLKYAISIILRSGGSITIYSGLDEYKLTTKSVTIRGQAFDVVCCNDQELGFTTELGKNWQMWQAFRELHCNTVDENGTTANVQLDPSESMTTIVVRSDEFAKCHAEMEKYFMTAEPVCKTPMVEFHGPSASVFYRSILVGNAQDGRPFMFTPNVTGQLELTEDRTFKDYWMVKKRIAEAILTCENEEFMEQWLTADNTWAEHYLDLDWSSQPPTQLFLDVAGRLVRDPSRPLNVSVSGILSKFRKVPEPISCKLFPSEQEAMDAAIEFCHALMYQVDEFPIMVVESLGPSILGKANIKTRQIQIARRAISMGNMTLATTLIEEWAHIKHGLEDCDRGMQNWLLGQIARIGAAYIHEMKERAQ